MPRGFSYQNIQHPKGIFIIKVFTTSLLCCVRDNFLKTFRTGRTTTPKRKIRCLENWHWCNIPSLPAGSMIFIWWKLKMSYHTAYSNWDSQAVVCHLFLYSFICAATTAFTWLSKFCTLQHSSDFYLSWELSLCRVSVLKGDLQFKNFFKEHNLYRFVQIKVHWKTFRPFYPPPFSPLVWPPYRN
jgi:hypothetical protein